MDRLAFAAKFPDQCFRFAFKAGKPVMRAVGVGLAAVVANFHESFKLVGGVLLR